MSTTVPNSASTAADAASAASDAAGTGTAAAGAAAGAAAAAGVASGAVDAVSKGRFDRRTMLRVAAAGALGLAVPVGLRKLGVTGTAATAAGHGAGHGVSTAEVIGGTFIGDYEGTSPQVAKFAQELKRPAVLRPAPGATLTGRAVQKDIEILPGKTSRSWVYEIGGQTNPLIEVQRVSYSAAEISSEAAHRAKGLTINMTNTLPEKLSLHLHGSATLPDDDGHPQIYIGANGGTKSYTYPNYQNARTLWYHDHAMHFTSRHVYQGLVGAYVIRDSTERNSGLPQGDYDVYLTVHDKLFGADGQLVYDDDGQKDLLGDVQLVNNTAWPKLSVERRRYRFRILTASVSRGYEYKFSNNMEFAVVGTDAGLMPKAQKTTRLIAGMAERYEIVVDFEKVPVGSRVTLLNTRADGAMREVMAFDVTGPARNNDNNPTLAQIYAFNLNPEVGAHMADIAKATPATKRDFRFERSGGQWVINGKPWEDNRFDALPKKDSYEVWNLYNNSGGWFHPIHIHLVDFVVQSRNGRAPFVWEKGLKDVAYVGENETVPVKMQFTPHLGEYVMHCHNNVHEDHDMMTHWKVV